MTTFNKIDFDSEMERFANKLDVMQQLMDNFDGLTQRDQSFAGDLISTFQNLGALSAKQWEWVGKLNDRVEGTKLLYGDFKAIRVAFMIAGDKLKCPKIRLLTKKDKFVQLNFYPDSNVIKIFIDGWAGHGYRKFAGIIEDDLIKPYSKERLTDDVYEIIEELANDPMGVAKAFANKLGVCMYCGQRLADHISKHYGYGPVCAKHYGLVYDKKVKLKAVS